MWIAIVPLWIIYNLIGAYVAYSAFKNGYIRAMATHEWLLAVTSWPWLLWHIGEIERERGRMRPFEEYMDRYEKEQLDKRLDDIE